MLIDPFVNGFAELHDPHIDMMVDVDNMSYEVNPLNSWMFTFLVFN